MKIKRNRKLKGSVLLTVVFVMAILIVFLFGTMSLAIAASNRSHVNYSSAQTSVTARTVAESAIMALANSSDEGTKYAEAVCDLKKGMSQTVNVRISQGGSDVSGIGDISQVTIEHVGSTQFFDPTSEQWEPRDVLKFTANVEMGGVMSTSSVYVVKHLEQDKITTAGGGAGFVTTAGADLKTQTSIYGGAYINLPTLVDAAKYKYVDDYATRMTERTFTVDNGSMKKIDGDIILQNSAAVIEADLFVNNNLFLENWSGIVFPGEKKGVTVLGDLTFKLNARDHFNYYMAPQNNSFKAVEGEEPSTVDFTAVPYIYVDGIISGETVKLGNGKSKDATNYTGPEEQDFPLNTFCGSISTFNLNAEQNVTENNAVIKDNQITNANTNGFFINSNLYCMDKGATSYIVAQNKTDLVNFADSTLNKTVPKTNEEISGEICSNGNLVLQNVTVNGDVRVAGTLTVYGEVTVNGNIVAKDIEEIDGSTLICNNGTIYRDDKAEGGNVETIDLTIPNKVGYFYDYTPTQKTIEGVSVYVGIDDQPLNDSYFENGNLKDGKDNIPKIYYTMAENNHAFMVEEGEKPALHSGKNGELIENTHYFYEDSADYDKFAIANDLAKSALESDFKTELDAGAVVYGFYYETTGIKNFHPAAAVLPEGYEKAKDANGNEYMFQREVNYSRKIEDTNPTVDVQGEITNNVNNTKAYLDTKNETTIYPFYALRDAVLGLNGKTETKIVKTVEEVVQEVNPYQPSDMPDGLNTNGYSETPPKSYPTTPDNSNWANSVRGALANEMGVLVTTDKLPAGYDTSEENEENHYKLFDVDYYKVSKAHYPVVNNNDTWGNMLNDSGSTSVVTLITSDCVLNGSGSESDLFKYIYIDPGDENIIIGIKNVGFPSGGKIIVNDKCKGKVYFYIENGGTLDLNGTTLLTSSYWDLLLKNKEISFESTITGAKEIEDLGERMKPNVFIFGGTNSTLALDNTSMISAYIKSPNINTTIGGEVNATVVDKFYYHNYNIFDHAKPTIIGCFNVKEVTSNNKLNSVYIPQDKKNDDDIIIQVGQHWYVPYYYSEF